MAEANSAAEGSKKSRKGLIIGVLLAVVLLGGGGAAAFFLLGGEPSAEETVDAGPADAIYTKIRTLEGKPMFVVTLQSDDGRRHYLQAYVETLSRDPQVDATLTLHMPLVVARLNALLGAQRFESLRTIEGKLKLKDEAN